MVKARRCMVCDEKVDSNAGKYHDDAPVYTDNGVYHLGCEDKVIETVFAEVES